MSLESTLRRVCVDEYEAYHLYRSLAKTPILNQRLREVLEKASGDELKHYMFWSGIVGDCKSRLSIVKVFLYRVLLFLFGVTITLKIVESMEVEASKIYSDIIGIKPELRDDVVRIIEDEKRHEKEFLSGLDEGRIRYLGSITLGISDALIELTGIYTGSLGAFESTLSAGLTGLLAGIAASISMGIASYSQAKHEALKNPKISAVYTSTAYTAVVLVLALPYFVLNSIAAAFTAMLLLATTIVAYMTLYTAVLHSRSFLKEFVESIALILGVSVLLYVLGLILGKVVGVKPAG